MFFLDFVHCFRNFSLLLVLNLKMLLYIHKILLLLFYSYNQINKSKRYVFTEKKVNTNLINLVFINIDDEKGKSVKVISMQ